MKKKLILKISAGILGIFLILFIVLVVHVGQVTVLKKNDKRNRQLSRIDFKEDIDAGKADQIKAYVASLDGVCGVSFNVAADNLTYMYDPALQTSSNVFNKLIASGHYQAERYIVNNDDMAKGCPAFAEKSGFSKVVLYCSNALFN